MSVLHTLNKSPLETNLLSDIVRSMQPDDDLLLIEDGTYALLTDNLLEITAPARCYALIDDINTRGLTEKNIAVTRIDMDGYVQLCCQHQSVRSWY